MKWTWEHNEWYGEPDDGVGSFNIRPSHEFGMLKGNQSIWRALQQNRPEGSGMIPLLIEQRDLEVVKRFCEWVERATETQRNLTKIASQSNPEGIVSPKNTGRTRRLLLGLGRIKVGSGQREKSGS